jgi:hypothetical protein
MERNENGGTCKWDGKGMREKRWKTAKYGKMELKELGSSYYGSVALSPS